MNIVILVGMFMVFLSMALGLVSMVRGQSMRSNFFMRLRVLIQGLTVIVLLCLVFLVQGT